MKIKVIENGIFEKNQLQDLETLSPQDLNLIIGGGCFLNICGVDICVDNVCGFDLCALNTCGKDAFSMCGVDF